jgi:hypothetical protein
MDCTGGLLPTDRSPRIETCSSAPLFTGKSHKQAKIEGGLQP